MELITGVWLFFNAVLMCMFFWYALKNAGTRMEKITFILLGGVMFGNFGLLFIR